MIMLLISCSIGEISVNPSTLDFGEVDFNAEPLDCDSEEGGCSPTRCGRAFQEEGLRKCREKEPQ